MNWNKKAMLGLESKRLQSKIIAIVLNCNFKNTISVVTCNRLRVIQTMKKRQ
jgi:hypothetical protein